MTTAQLSLLIPLRKRSHQARSVLPLLQGNNAVQSGLCDIVVIESDVSPLYKELCSSLGIKYFFDPNNDAFHKSRLLNIGLNISFAKFVTPFDIDLVPYYRTLEAHIHLSSLSEDILVTGFRLMSPIQTPSEDLTLIVRSSALGPENSPSAIRKWLVDGERFGVSPHFSRSRLEKIGGWDETFIGWGAEDQDVIERYLETGTKFVTSPDLLYLHLAHPQDIQWGEEKYKSANRDYYYEKRRKRESQAR